MDPKEWRKTRRNKSCKAEKNERKGKHSRGGQKQAAGFSLEESNLLWVVNAHSEMNWLPTLWEAMNILQSIRRQELWEKSEAILTPVRCGPNGVHRWGFMMSGNLKMLTIANFYGWCQMSWLSLWENKMILIFQLRKLRHMADKSHVQCYTAKNEATSSDSCAVSTTAMQCLLKEEKCPCTSPEVCCKQFLKRENDNYN